MIPEKLLRDAKAEYRGNVYQFISLGERKKLDRFDYIHIKQKYPDVQDWFERLDTTGQLRVMKHLREIYEKSRTF